MKEIYESERNEGEIDILKAVQNFTCGEQCNAEGMYCATSVILVLFLYSATPFLAPALSSFPGATDSRRLMLLLTPLLPVDTLQ